jgi:TrmH family RNA methyltransferase
MGALFRINFKHYDTIQQYVSEYSAHNLYPFMLDGAKDIREVKFKKPFSIIQGNEGRGLDGSFKDLGQSVYIPHTDDIDSLNLAVATSISLWESSKQS